MIKYLSQNPDKFTAPYAALLVALMQLCGGLFAEICNLLVLTQRHNAIHCLEHFVAFEILTHVDNIYCHALPHFPLKEELKNPIHITSSKETFKEKTTKNKIIYLLEMVLFWFYTLIFYYFTPFWVGAIPYLYKAMNPHAAPAAAH